jgi:glucosamine-6-phosphate deaminase
MPLARAWMLDEYLGLPEGDHRSYASYLREKVFVPLEYPGELINLPRLASMAAQEAADEYEDRLRAAGGLGVQLLGIGHNGHLGLNEPGSSVNSRTRVVTIAESTRVANKDFFASLEEVPREAVTLGLGTLSEAKELWLLAIGLGKARIIQRMLEGAVSEDVPATLLRQHPGLKVFLDQEAASLLKPIR